MQRLPLFSQVAMMASLLLVSPSSAEDTIVAPPAQISKTADFSIKVSKEIFHEMLISLPEAKISPNREKIIEDLVRKIGQNAPEIAADKQPGIAAEIYEKTILPLLTPRIEEFNNLMVSAATKDKVSAGFLAFKGLAEGMGQFDDHASLTIYGSHSQKKNGAADDCDWSWNSFSSGGELSQYISAKIDEKPTVDLKPYGYAKSFDFIISCKGKVDLKKVYRKNYYFTEKPHGKAKTSVSLIPEVELTASKSIEDNYMRFFTVEGEDHRSVSKTIPYEASLVFDFDANPKAK